jgi:hypothetical protein
LPPYGSAKRPGAFHLFFFVTGDRWRNAAAVTKLDA